MKESDFIDKNKKKWKEVEENLSNANVSPNDTSKLFVQVTADLSYARTFYKSRSVRIYLNEIAKSLFNDINKTESSNLGSFVKFWKTDLPLIMCDSRRSMLISFIIFVVCFILGVISSIYDPDFAATILSSGYINMTNENIAKGDAMAVYKSGSEMQMFLDIFLNNIRIDFITFFSGIFMSIGTVIIMIVNGVMVGVFQYFFIQKGLFWDSFLAIWTHGTIEISTIILSGGAGLTLGKGLLFPGTYSRLHALRISGLKGMKIIIAVFPLTLLAAFIEGFLTRHTSIPDVLRFSFILLSLFFILFYFFWYPRRVAKQEGNDNESIDISPVYKAQKIFDPNEILTRDTIIKLTFRVFLKNVKFFMRLILLVSFAFAFLICLDSFSFFYNNDYLSSTGFEFFNFLNYPLLGLLSFVCLTFVNLKSVIHTTVFLNPSNKIKATLSLTIASAIFSGVAIGFLGVAESGYKMFVCLLIPLFSLILTVIANQQLSFFKGINLTGILLNKQWTMLILGTVFSFIMCYLLIIGINLSLRALNIQDSLVWALTSDEETGTKIRTALYIIEYLSSYLFYIVLANIYNGILFFTLKEINTAENLISRINQIKAVK